MPAMVTRFAAPGKPRGMVAPAYGRAYILSVSASPPKFVRPCVPTTAKAIPRGDAWLHEPKLDGYRFQIVKDGRLLRLHSKSGSDWTKRLSRLAEALAAIRCWSAVIDCELVFPAADGRPDFYRLQSGMAAARQHELAVFAFDLLHYGGEDLRPAPLIDRRVQLTELVARSSVPCLHLVWGFDDGAKLLEVADRHGLEGIVSKRQTSAYRSGPSRDWVKIKTAAWRAANRERWRMFEKR
jgi:bifunctional non-homologous end joining protein LigD